METSAVEESVRQLRAVLDDVDAGRLACSRGMRNRIEGAVLALDAAAERSEHGGKTMGSGPHQFC